MTWDLSFWLLAITGVLIAGIAKGGFSGGAAFVATPMLALSVGPVNAAAIMLPLLMMMDVIALRAYWRQWSWPDGRVLILGAVPGIILGWLLFSVVDERLVKLALGVMSLGFVAYMMAKARGWITIRKSEQINTPVALSWGATAGFTSFVSHAGGPPASMHLLSRPIAKTTYQATSTLLFMMINAVKAPFYASLGLFGAVNVKTSLALLPLAVAGILIGIWLHKRVSEAQFYVVIYLCLIVVGGKLIIEGLAG